MTDNEEVLRLVREATAKAQKISLGAWVHLLTGGSEWIATAYMINERATGATPEDAIMGLMAKLERRLAA